MADMNSVMLSGWLTHVGIRNGSFPSGWMRVTLDPVQPRSSPMIDQQGIFLSVTLGERDRDRFGGIQAGGWVQAWDLTFSSYNAQDGSLRRGLKTKLGKMRISPHKGMSENIVVLHGMVKDLGPDFFELGCSYMNPKAQNPQEKWRENLVRVYPDGFPLPAPGMKLYVRGRVSGKTPAGEELLCVMADVIS